LNLIGTTSSTLNNGRHVNIVASDGILFFFLIIFIIQLIILIIHLYFIILKVELSGVSEINSDGNDPDFGNELLIFVLL